MWNFNFICRESKADRNGLSPIELSIVIEVATKSKQEHFTDVVKCFLFVVRCLCNQAIWAPDFAGEPYEPYSSELCFSQNSRYLLATLLGEWCFSMNSMLCCCIEGMRCLFSIIHLSLS